MEVNSYRKFSAEINPFFVSLSNGSITSVSFVNFRTVKQGGVLWGPFADPFQILRCQFQIPRRKPRPFAALKNNLHTASFVTEKDMCMYAQMMIGSIERGLRFLGRAQCSDGARALLRLDIQ